ncbi:hypothetical protein [Nostoc sp. MG11]|uniref:hypothetical protein n=1 Tax=Nostoc sp. MG11 TaxID=2721166 RepID=UPI001867C230|nr:hypothetical protein [Nostoc sp. MG11]
MIRTPPIEIGEERLNVVPYLCASNNVILADHLEKSDGVPPTGRDCLIVIVFFVSNHISEEAIAKECVVTPSHSVFKAGI